MIDATGEGPVVSASIFDRYGQWQQTGILSQGSLPVGDANPVAAELPAGAFAVAWNDFGGDGGDLGIALRRLSSQREAGPLKFVNDSREFSQRDPDLIWDGTQLVAAWVDFGDAGNSPDVRYRTFDAELHPTSGELTLAATHAPESDVVLAKVQGGWCAAYREGTEDGQEYVVVRSGERATRVGPVLGGPIGDKPALVELDGDRVLVVFSEAVLPQDGPANFFRLSYAVVDRTEDRVVAPVPLNPLDPVWRRNAATSQVSPSAERGGDGIYVAWRSEAMPGDAAGDQVWLKLVRWLPPLGAAAGTLRLDETELLIPRTCEESFGDQRAPALARTPLPPYGGLAIAWEDYGATQGEDSGEPEVVVHFAPTHPRQPAGAAAAYVEDAWDAADGAAWSPRWATDTGSAGTATTQRGAGQVTGSNNGRYAAYVGGMSARDVELLTDVKLSPSARAGAFARRPDADPSTYLAFRFGSLRDEPWRIYAMIYGVSTDIAVLAPPNNVPARVADLVYRLRFRVDTLADGQLFLAARVWAANASEPTTWSIQRTLPADSPLAQTFAARGRFGLQATPSSSARKATFDNFRAKFFEGDVQGDLDAIGSSWPLPLKRELASYRRCTPGAPCVEEGGCCEQLADCDSGAGCASKLGSNLPLGSHANACVVDHCTNARRDADEDWVDCGGSDCAPCNCAVSATPGTASYCPAGCPCGTGDASCTQDSQCFAGLACSSASGAKYGFAQGTASCTPYHCANASLDLGETWPDCGGECGACSILEVTPVAGAINAASGSLQKVVAQAPVVLSSVAGLTEGKQLCVFSDTPHVTLGALAFNRVRDYTLVPRVPACFVADSTLTLQSTNLPDEVVTSPADVANLDWHLSNEPSQFQLNGLNISRWLASAGGSSRDVAQSASALQPLYSSGGALMDGSRYFVGSGSPGDWTFLHQPGTLFMVFRPDTAVTGYLLGTVHDSNPAVGNGFGIYFDASVSPPRLRYRVGNSTGSYVFGFTTPRAFPIGEKVVLATTMTDTKLEAFKGYDSLGSDAGAGSLSGAAPYSAALLSAKASTAKTPFPGAVFEVLHYSGAMSQRARQAIVTYLNAKHGVVGPPSHCQNQAHDEALGEVAPDCGGACGCVGACASQCGLTVRDYPADDTGSFFNVNLLRRSPQFPRPVASVSFANDATLWSGSDISYTIDGKDAWTRYSTPTGLDEDAAATIVYDLGSQWTLGALRQTYQYLSSTAQRYRVRVGSGASPISWTEVVPETTLISNETLTVFPATPGRYVELTLLGTPAATAGSNGRGIVELVEVAAFASTSQSPAPNTSQGYDLTYLSGVTASLNSNMRGVASSLFDRAVTGINGATLAQGANGNAEATVDLGGLYQVSQITLGFRLSASWETGGRVQLGVDSGPGNIAWTDAYDTGQGQSFGVYPAAYPITPRLARYVRLTNYFISGEGLSPGRLDEIGIF